MGIRRQIDGGFFTTLTNDRAIAELKKKYRLDDNVWYPRTNDLRDVYSLEDAHPGRILQIVGKGPSLESLTVESFTAHNPIMCINNSIAILDSIDQNLANYVIQCDGNLRESCRPQSATLLLGWPSRGYYESYANRIVFNTEHLFAVQTDITAAHAIRFAAFMGCKGVQMLAFDSVAGNFGYPSRLGNVKKAIQELKAGDRYKTHKAHLERLAKSLGLSLDWIPTWEANSGHAKPKSAPSITSTVPVAATATASLSELTLSAQAGPSTEILNHQPSPPASDTAEDGDVTLF